MKKDFTALDLIRIITKNTKLFIIVGSISLVISVGIALLLPNYYKSTCILYPFNPEAYDPRNVNNATNPYGSTMDGDRIMALAISREVQQSIIKKYNLLDRYEIDKTDRLADFNVTEEFNSNFGIAENEYSAIEISFYDVNPDTAALIVNDIVLKIDELNKKPLVDISQKIFESYEALITEKYSGIDTIQKLVDHLDFKTDFARSEIISMQMLHTLTELQSARRSLALIKKDFSSLNIIQRAEPISKKAKPLRSLIVISSVIASLFITFLTLLSLEFYQQTLKNEEQ